MARTKKIKRDSSFVKLRIKELSKGRRSFYLDIYKDGKRSYEFLKLYLVPETNNASKIQNENTQQAALAIRNQRELEIIQDKGGLSVSTTGGKLLLVDWLKAYQQQKSELGQSQSRACSVEHMTKHVKSFNGKTRLADVDENWCKDFITYLSKAKKENGQTIKKSTANAYFQILNASLNEAVRKGKIKKNPANNLSREERKPIKAEKSKRPYLTIEEVKTLMATDCKTPEIKRAFLFACFTGLRISDIRNLQWSNITKDNGVYRMAITMQKTREPLTMKLNKKAVELLPKEGNGKVFHLPIKTTIDYAVKSWVKKAGINKNVSFHVSRHTFATMELTLGVDLYVVSKLLGHANVGTTQIYAEIINQRRDEAVDLIDNSF